MTTKEDVVRKFRELLDKKADLLEIRFAQTGDGSSASTYDVVGKPGWCWVRYSEKQSQVSQVFTDYPGWPQDVPVIVGRKHQTDHYERILGINLDLYIHSWNPDTSVIYALPAHGSTHHAVSGNDPAYIDVRNVLPGRVRQTDVASLSVYAEPLSYVWQATQQTFGSAVIDLTSYVPATTNYHRYVLVYLDAATNSLGATAGVETPLAATPDVPAITIGTIPLGLALLYQGQTTIVEADLIGDPRVLFAVEGAAILDMNERDAHLEAEFDMLISRHVVEGV